MNLIEHALDFAHNAHRGQKRKDGITPYIVHPIEVMRLLQECGCHDEEQLATALLHDTIEDCEAVTYDKLRWLFGAAIAARVERLTKPPASDKAAYIADLAKNACEKVVVVKAADRICNARDFRNSGDAAYASKYLNVKGAPIFDALVGLAGNEVANELRREWNKLDNELDEMMYGKEKDIV